MLLKGDLFLKKNYPIIAIVGRPNVGKSSLFNAIIRKKKSIIDDAPGITRDRIYEQVLLQEKYPVYFVDTGGISEKEEHLFLEEIVSSAKNSIQEATLVLFVVDPHNKTQDDEEIAKYLRRHAAKKTFLVVNKVDNEALKLQAYESYSYGFDTVLFTSAVHTQGIEEIKETVFDYLMTNHLHSLQETEQEAESQEPLRLTLLGKPNAGKSSFLNLILGHERSIVSPIPGTTRDAIEEPFSFLGKKAILIDTAGMRRKSKIDEKLEYVSTKRAIQAIEKSHVVLLLLDSQEGITDQDKKLVHLAVKRGKGILIGMNKWDLVQDEVDKEEYLSRTRFLLRVAPFVPIVEISVKNNYNIQPFLKKAFSISESYQKKVSTHQLTEFLRDQIKEKPLFTKEGEFKIYYAIQKEIAPPKFQIHVNYEEVLNEAYIKFLNKSIRDYFQFEGIPMSLEIKNRERKKK